MAIIGNEIETSIETVDNSFIFCNQFSMKGLWKGHCEYLLIPYPLLPLLGHGDIMLLEAIGIYDSGCGMSHRVGESSCGEVCQRCQ